MIRVKFIFLLLLSLVVLSCCPTTSLNPLSSAKDAQYDKRLEGTWIHHSENEGVGYLHIGRTEGNITKAIATEVDKNGELDYTVFTMFPTIVDGNHYLNINAEEVLKNTSPEKAGYIFARYELSGNDNLSVYYMKDDQFAKAIQTGKLKGEVTYRKGVPPESKGKENTVDDQKKIDCIRITDTPANILSFMENNSPDTLFYEGFKATRATIK